jgi:DNA-binding NarL/FixJ family response regulator
MSTFRALVVDDFEPFRHAVASILQQKLELQIISEASDGLEAVQKAKELQPDLILLDIGLPKLNGIEAARQIREVSPSSRILFMSQGSSAGIVQETLSLGARGYVVKSDAGSELLTAVNAALRGETFVSRRLAGHDFIGADTGSAQAVQHNSDSAPVLLQNRDIAHRHEVGFYSNDRSFLDDPAQFIGAALAAGNAAIVVATESHRDSLLRRLQAYGLDMDAAIEQGRYIALDAADTLSTFMVNGMPDPVRFVEGFGNAIRTAAKAAKTEHPGVAVFGEGVNLVWAQGNAEAAIEIEKLSNHLTHSYDVDILCGYALGSVWGGMDSHTFQRICAEHSAVYSR